jgi:hypothetical protein
LRKKISTNGMNVYLYIGAGKNNHKAHEVHTKVTKKISL